MRDIATTFAELAGLILIAVGLGAIYVPLGIVALGVALVVIGYRQA